MFTHRCLTLLIAVFLTALSHAQPLSSSSTGHGPSPIITRISGCTDVGDITINCPRATEMLITVYGSNFLNSTKNVQYGYILSQTGSAFGAGASGGSTGVTWSDSIIILRFNPLLYGHFMNDRPINLTVTNSNQPIAPAIAGLSFVAPLPLSITRITGCPVISSDGLSASNCDYLTPITMIGSGFNQLVADRPAVQLGSATFTGRIPDPTRIVDDSTMLFDPKVSSMTIPIEAYTGAVTMQVKSQLWNITAISLSYSSFPSVDITGILSTNGIGCVSDDVNGPFRLSGCFAGRSGIILYGRFLWPDTQVWIGSFLLPPTQDSRGNGVQSKYLQVDLPIMDTESGIYYDLKIVNAVTSLTLPNAIGFVSGPQIANMTQCVQKHVNSAPNPNNWKAYCLEGEIFSFTAVNIRGRSTPQVWFGPYECPNVRVIDDRIVQCTVPRDPDGTASVREGLFLSWPDYNSASIPFELWDYPLAARITELTSPSCYASSETSKPLQCLYDAVNGLNLTVYASRMPLSQIWTCRVLTDVGAWPSESATVDETVGSVTCYWKFLQMNTLYAFQVRVRGQSDDEGSNLKPFVVVDQITFDNTSASSDSRTLTIALCIILPLVCVLAVMIASYWRRQRNLIKSSGSIVMESSVSSEESKDIELA